MRENVTPIRIRLSQNIIYGLHDGDGVIRYVGLSSNGTERLYRHRYLAKRGMVSPLYTWARKHGVNNMTMTILEDVPIGDLELLDAREIFWIAKLGSEGAALLNMTDGGRRVAGYTHSAETRAKMSANSGVKSGKDNPLFGIPLSLETRRKLSESATGKRAGEDHHNAKLTWVKVAEIRKRLLANEPTTHIAKDYGVSYQTICYIRDGHTRKGKVA